MYYKMIISIIVFIILLTFNVFAEQNNYQLANLMYYNYDFKKAISLYEKILQKDVEHKKEIYLRLGNCYLIKNNPKVAYTYFLKAKKLQPNIFKGKTYRVSSKGMYPTLYKGDNVLIEKKYYDYKDYSRGDIITFLLPENRSKVFIKRIIGLPGETIHIKNKKIYVNNEKLYESYAQYNDNVIKEKFPTNKWPPNDFDIRVRDNLGPIEIPENKFFVLGDNRAESYDSRFWGFVDREEIIGKAFYIFYSSPNNKNLKNERKRRRGKVLE